MGVTHVITAAITAAIVAVGVGCFQAPDVFVPLVLLGAVYGWVYLMVSTHRSLS